MSNTIRRQAGRVIAGLLAAMLLLAGPAVAAPKAGSSPGTPPDKTQSVADAAAIAEIDRSLAQMNSDELAATLKLFRARRIINNAYVDDTANVDLMTGAVKGAIAALDDPYSNYLDARTLKEFLIETKGSFGGVGLVLGVKDKQIIVIAPIEGTPADRAGLISGDHILAINGKSTKEMALDEAVSMIRGQEGTEVTLTVGREGQDKSDYSIVRDTIQIKTVSGKMLDNNIGYLRVTFFNENTGADLAAKFHELESQGMQATILDLRNNPGGLLGESVKVASLFIPPGPVVSVVYRDGSRQTSNAQPGGGKYPLVVLINNGSASASEIVAGAIQDTGAGTLVGTRSFGKGSVQSIIPLGDDTAIKLTIAKYHTPKDRVIHGIGVEPDIFVVQPLDARETATDRQLEKAIEILKNKLNG